MLEGKSIPAKWNEAVNAFNYNYNPSTPLRAQIIPTPEQRPITWGDYLRFNSDLLQANIDYLELYAFVHAFTGNDIANWHPTLTIQAIFSDSYREQLRRIREASRRGAEAAKTHKQNPPLEEML